MSADGAVWRMSVLLAELGGYHTPTPSDPHGIQALVTQVRGWLDTAAGIVWREGGRVRRASGHRVMGVFGDAAQPSDHPRKAMAAALAIRAESLHLQAFHVRLSIATDLGLIADFGPDGHPDSTVVGHALNRAEELLWRAPPDGLLVSSETRAACSGAFEYQPIPGFGHLVLGLRLDDPERTGTRVHARAEVIVRTAAQAAPGVVNNVSAGGMHIGTVLALKVGDSVEVELAPVPELTGLAPVLVRGVVRHLRPSADGSPGLGMSIDRADSADPEAMKHFAALYFRSPITPGERVITDDGERYRLVMSKNSLQILREASGSGGNAS